MTTELYLIRHGIAAERGTYANDDDRPLTDEGRDKTRQVAKRLKALGVQVDLILTSPLVRAQQTAEILKKVGLSDRLEIASHLAPDGNFDDWLVWLQQEPRSPQTRLALVGHEPDLSEWAERLIWGEPRQQIILKKAGIIALNLPKAGSPIGQSHLFWLAPPRFLL